MQTFEKWWTGAAFTAVIRSAQDFAHEGWKAGESAARADLREGLARLVNEIESEDCVCGAGMQKDLPTTWSHCGVHQRVTKIRALLTPPAAAGRESEEVQKS
jgi:hypothetical protein